MDVNLWEFTSVNLYSPVRYNIYNNRFPRPEATYVHAGWGFYHVCL